MTGHMPDEGMGHCIREVHEVPLWAMLIGCLSLPCLLLGPSFQYAKFWNTQCAEGVSALTLAIGSLARGLICVNLVILHYDQLYVCYVNDAEHPQNWVHCQASFLVVYGGIFGFMVYFPQYLCVMYLINQRERASYYKSVRWGAMAVFSTLVLTAAPIMVSVLERSCEATESYGIAIGFVSTVFLCLQFTPQLYTSLLLRTAGSMSYLAYGLDVLGGAIILQLKLFGTHEDISSWLPVMLMHMFEGAILGVNVYYDHKRGVLAESICAEVWFVPKRYRTCGPKLETKPLLQRDPEAPSSGDSSPAEPHSAPPSPRSSKAAPLRF